MNKIQDIPLNAEMRVLLRADLNVPLADGKVQDDTRIQAALPSMRVIWEQGASLIILSHLGRPDKNKTAAEQPQFSLRPVARHLSQAFGHTIELVATPKQVPPRRDGQSCWILENTRFLAGETKNDPQLAEELGNLADVYVMDAFGSAHRAHASTVGITHFVPRSCAGLLVQQEVEALDRVLANPARPLVAILGGAKVGDKLAILKPIAELADYLILGGGIANTFLAAAGKEVGASLYEPDLIDQARALMEIVEVPLPKDVVVASSLDSPSGRTQALGQIAQDDMILDLGEQTLAQYATLLAKAKTVLWNGPLGVFEKEPFAAGTRALAQIIAKSSAYCLAGGGDTIAAINAFTGVATLDRVSTGGGAFLEYIEKNGELPALTALQSSVGPGSSAG